MSALWEILPVACFELDKLGRFAKVNTRVAELLGRPPSALLDTPIARYLHPADGGVLQNQIWSAYTQPGRELSSCLRFHLLDGTTRTLILYTRLREGGDFSSNCPAALAVPPPQQRSLQERELFDHLPYGVVWLDSEERIVEGNAAISNLLGFASEQLKGTRVSSLFLDWSTTSALMAALQNRPFRLEGVRRDGVAIPIEAALSSVNPPLDERAFLLSLRDLREQESLERRSLRIAELERQAVGRELHDALGQSLVSMAFLADELSATLEGSPEDTVRAAAVRANRLAEVCRETCATMRTLVRGLVPLALTKGDLPSALRDLAHSCQVTSGIACQARCQRVDVDADTASHLFRIAQESVTNALKHAQCSRIDIVLRSDKGGVVLQVTDDGRGVPLEDRQRFGTGLHSIRHRCKLLGAHLQVGLAPTGGTQISVQLPRDSRSRASGPRASEDNLREA